MSAFLITGNPGSGKTALAAELTRRGLVAVDADHSAYWETASGAPVDHPDHVSDEWLASHRWVWSRERIEDIIRSHATVGQHVFLCGIATNQRDMLDLFSLVFLLSIEHRPRSRGSTRPLTLTGTQPSERRSCKVDRCSSRR